MRLSSPGLSTLALVVLVAGACKHDDRQNLDMGTDDAAGFVGDGGDETVDMAGGGFIEVDGGLVACATDTQKATLKPLDLYLMVDSSGSMNEATASGATKWTAVSNAIGAFVNDPASSGIGIGLQFFPLIKPNTTARTCNVDADCGAEAPCINNKACVMAGPVKFCQSNADCGGITCAPVGRCQNGPYACFSNGGPSCGKCLIGGLSYCSGRDSCVAADYQAPAVAISVLPGSAAGVTGALAGRSPDGLTPTAPALRGAVDRALAHATANPDHVVAAVLATDGFPTECAPQDIPSIAAIAGSGNMSMPNVRTFVIGVFTPDEQVQATSNLNQIASAGGSTSAFVIDTTQNVTQAFLSALNSIRGAGLPCEYTLPVPGGGLTPDYNKVNVQFTDAGSTKIVPYTSSAGACNAMLGGWYYDVDPASGTPTKVILCPKSCDAVRAASAGQVDIVQGCETIIL